MEDIKELCERVIIINLGKIIYDGQLSELTEKYAPYKILKVTFNGEGATREQIKRYGEAAEFNPYSVSFKVDRHKTKDAAAEILSSNLPVDDILIDEADIEEVVRKIFSDK